MSGSDSDSASSVGSIMEDASDVEIEVFQCVFCKVEAERVEQLFEHCEEQHKFNLLAAVKEAGGTGDDLVIFKLINYLRLQSEEGVDPSTIKITSSMLIDDKLLKPVLEDDALLHSLGDYITPAADEKTTEYEEYERFLAKKLEDIDIKKEAKLGHNDSYFESYKGAAIHREMIEDRVRTESYKNFTEKFDYVFKDKVVLDVGCGTGILSLFCARAGARKVFAVDNSEIAIKAKANVAANKYDHIVEVIQGRVEDEFVKRKIGRKGVDVIVSEWMGYGLLYEGMLDSVLAARDYCLKEGGTMAPSHCTMFIAPISNDEWIAEETGEKFWKDVHGFDFSAMMPSTALNERDIAVLDVPKESLSSEPAGFYVLDLARITTAQLEFTSSFSTQMSRDVGNIGAFTIYFDTFFFPHDTFGDEILVSGKEGCVYSSALTDWKAVNDVIEKDMAVAFSTGPGSTSTHWHQAVLLVGKEDRGEPRNAGDVLAGTVTYRKAKGNARAYEVEIRWKDKDVERAVVRSIE